LLPLALFLEFPGFSGDQHGLTRPVEVFMALYLSKSERGCAAQKTSIGSAKLVVGTEDEGMRVGTAVGKWLYA
jgi:hypothetical protein